MMMMRIKIIKLYTSKFSSSSIFIEWMDSNEFQWYLTGLIDSISIIKVSNTNKVHQLQKPKLILRLKHSEENILYSIKNKIDGFSSNILIPSQIIKRESNYIDLEIYDLNLLIIIINMIKDKMMTREIAQINKLIHYINIIIPIIINKNLIKDSKSTQEKTNSTDLIWNAGYNEHNIISINMIEYIQYPFTTEKSVDLKQKILKTEWFRAFIDTKGVFFYNYIKDSEEILFNTVYNITLTSNKKDGIDNKFIIEALSEIFKCKYSLKEGIHIYKIYIETTESKSIFLKYLDNHPLITNKLKDYMDFKRMSNYELDIKTNKYNIIKWFIERKNSNK